MSTRRLAWSVWALCVALTLVGLGFLVLNGNTQHANSIGSPAVDAVFGVLFLTFPTAGAAIASREPANAIGWLFLGAGVGAAVEDSMLGNATYTLLVEPGSMWQKTYQVRLPSERVSPTDLIETWKQKFPDFWPEGNRFYGPLTGIAPGEVALLNMTLPGRLKLSTGVMVLYADEESFTLMTPQGHMFAGWITFSATETKGETVAQAQVLMRASDPIFELGLAMGGHRQEDRFWAQTLTAVGSHFGQDCEVDTQVVCVDKKRQWSKWTNIWHSSAIRSSVYMLGAPYRGVRSLFRRDSSAKTRT